MSDQPQPQLSKMTVEELEAFIIPIIDRRIKMWLAKLGIIDDANDPRSIEELSEIVKDYAVFLPRKQ